MVWSRWPAGSRGDAGVGAAAVLSLGPELAAVFAVACHLVRFELGTSDGVAGGGRRASPTVCPRASDAEALARLRNKLPNPSPCRRRLPLRCRRWDCGVFRRVSRRWSSARSRYCRGAAGGFRRLAARLALVACLRRLVACFVGDGAGGSSVISCDIQSVPSLTCGAARGSAMSRCLRSSEDFVDLKKDVFVLVLCSCRSDNVGRGACVSLCT